MKKRNTSIRRLAVAALAMILLATTVIAQVADIRGIVVQKNGGRVPGVIKWQPASKVYVVTDPRTGVALRIPLSDVSSVQVRDPAELDPAIKLVQSGQFARAVQPLEKIMQDYTMMGPDIKAARWLAEAYLKQGQSAKAVRMCEMVMDANPEAVTGDLASLYWDALIGSEQYAKLRKALSDATARGNRQVAAVAQMKRGDLEKKQGRNQEALIDGYLRVVVLYQDVKEVQPEALFKAAKCFEELGQMSHADKMRKKLLAEFPADPYSQKLRSGA